MHVVKWGAGQPRQRTTESNWKQPLKWNREAAQKGIRPRVFCASLADVFDNEIDPQWRIDLLRLIAGTPHLDWLLLTKRIGNAHNMMVDAFRAGWPEHETMWARWPELFRNIWLGATICNQEEADRDIPKLLAVPAAKRFLSIEPMLGPINLNLAGCLDGCGWITPVLCNGDKDFCCPTCNTMVTRCGLGITPGSFISKRALDWVIVGGESGTQARPVSPDEVRHLRDQCRAAKVPFLFKQWGEWSPREPYGSEWMESDELCGKWDGSMYRYGKKAAGRSLDGRTWDEVPI